MLLITSCEKDQLAAPGVVPGEAEIEQGVSDPLLNEGMIQLGETRRILTLPLGMNCFLSSLMIWSGVRRRA